MFSKIEIPEGVSHKCIGDTLIVQKWEWDYNDCLAFQKTAQKFIHENKKLKIYIFCNHPCVFTLGRGNERGDSTLVEFDSSLKSKLSFPIIDIKRGGGITFHHPGQWIFYPIVSLSPKYNLEELMCWMLKSVTDILKNEFDVSDAIAAKKLMGVWINRKKIASIGLGLERFITFHGLALNLQRNQQMEEELAKISPCGLESSTYISLESLNNKENNLDTFHKLYLESLFT